MILKIIYGLFILGVIVFIHEMGHFIAAITSGVKVEAFSIGMGPVLLHKKIRGVDWRISLFPVGGYCSMKGENFAESEKNVMEFSSEKDSLYGVSPLKRAFIAFAGPFSNLILTFFSFFLIALIGFSYWSASNKIILANEVYPQISSPAANAGIKTGDIIMQINEKKIEDFSELYSFVSLHPDEDLKIKVLREGKEMTFYVHSDLDKNTGSGKIGVVSDSSTTIKRQAKTYGFFGSLVQAGKETVSIFNASIKGIATLFKGVNVTKAVSGPASITTMLGDTVQSAFSSDLKTGLSSVLNFIALISISLFIMNLLPIPILDGGLILVSIIEMIFRTRISVKIRNRVQYIGLVFIAFFFIIAMIGDFNYFVRLFHEK
ncbi:M50 family metallopeptidase [Treponema pectinovorum]|uniref:M50 family metallopeptidase n=1 Tax=Treponema pectinovorum TaxID=164 RepID=UPI003D920081